MSPFVTALLVVSLLLLPVTAFSSSVRPLLPARATTAGSGKSLVPTLRGGGGSSSSALHSIVADLAASYNTVLANAPLLTNTVTAAGLATCSDTIAQRLTSASKSFELDPARTIRMAVWGAAVSGCALTFWFRLLARLFPRAATDNAQLFGKVFVNQLFMSPLLNGGFFAYVICTSRRTDTDTDGDDGGGRWAAVKRKIREDLPATVRRSCVYWSIVQTLNFRFLPQSCTTLVSNVAFLIWNVYLCIIGNRKR